MYLVEDKAQKEKQHILKNNYWKKHGIEVVRLPLPVGDYAIANDKVIDVMNRKAVRNIPVKKMDLLGTYDVCVDTKYSIQELVMDICGKQHERFRDECCLAMNNNIKLHILVENDREVVNAKLGVVNETIHDLKDLSKWVNKRLWIRKGGRQFYPNATRGVTLMKACYTMEQKYGVKFHFCSSREAGAKVLELLGVDADV